MLIKFSPVRLDVQLIVSVSGDVITLNGEDFDFTPLPEGATLPNAALSSEWFVGDVTRNKGELSLTLKLPHGPNAPESTRFPESFRVLTDGVVSLPVYDLEMG